MARQRQSVTGNDIYGCDRLGFGRRVGEPQMETVATAGAAGKSARMLYGTQRKWHGFQVVVRETLNPAHRRG